MTTDTFEVVSASIFSLLASIICLATGFAILKRMLRLVVRPLNEPSKKRILIALWIGWTLCITFFSIGATLLNRSVVA